MFRQVEITVKTANHDRRCVPQKNTSAKPETNIYFTYVPFTTVVDNSCVPGSVYVNSACGLAPNRQAIPKSSHGQLPGVFTEPPSRP